MLDCLVILIVSGSISLIVLSISILMLVMAKIKTIEIDNEFKQHNLNRLKYNEKN